MAGDKHRGAVVGEVVEGLPEFAAKDRVDIDGWLVEDKKFGLTEQCDRE